KRFAVCLHDPALLPRGDWLHARRFRTDAGRQPYFVAPTFAAAILAALKNIAGSAGKCIVGGSEGRDSPVPIEVDAHVEPYLRHPLGVPHGAGPGTDHFAWNRPATLDDQERVEELLLPIGAPARFPPSQGRQRRQYRPHVLWIDDD